MVAEFTFKCKKIPNVKVIKIEAVMLYDSLLSHWVSCLLVFLIST